LKVYLLDLPVQKAGFLPGEGDETLSAGWGGGGKLPVWVLFPPRAAESGLTRAARLVMAFRQAVVDIFRLFGRNASAVTAKEMHVPDFDGCLK
jgi:hypothetical protein